MVQVTSQHRIIRQISPCSTVAWRHLLHRSALQHYYKFLGSFHPREICQFKGSLSLFSFSETSILMIMNCIAMWSQSCCIYIRSKLYGFTSYRWLLMARLIQTGILMTFWRSNDSMAFCNHSRWVVH